MSNRENLIIANPEHQKLVNYSLFKEELKKNEKNLRPTPEKEGEYRRMMSIVVSCLGHAFFSNHFEKYSYYTESPHNNKLTFNSHMTFLVLYFLYIHQETHGRGMLLEDILDFTLVRDSFVIDTVTHYGESLDRNWKDLGILPLAPNMMEDDLKAVKFFREEIFLGLGRNKIKHVLVDKRISLKFILEYFICQSLDARAYRDFWYTSDLFIVQNHEILDKIKIYFNIPPAGEARKLGFALWSTEPQKEVEGDRLQKEINKLYDMSFAF